MRIRNRSCASYPWEGLTSVTYWVTYVTIMNTTDAASGPARLLFGKTRLAILALLFGRFEERFYLRQIARASGYGLGPVQRELKLLTEVGILRRSAEGRQVYFQADPGSPVFADLKSLLAKTVGIAGTLRDAIAPLAGRIKAAFIYGSIARGEERAGSDVDLLVVGEATFAEVVAALQAVDIETEVLDRPYMMTVNGTPDSMGVQYMVRFSVPVATFDRGELLALRAICHELQIVYRFTRNRLVLARGHVANAIEVEVW